MRKLVGEVRLLDSGNFLTDASCGPRRICPSRNFRILTDGARRTASSSTCMARGDPAGPPLGTLGAPNRSKEFLKKPDPARRGTAQGVPTYHSIHHIRSTWGAPNRCVQQ